MEVHYRGKFITGRITELSRNEIFVYGTDMHGNRVGRAEKLACEKFGAVQKLKSGLDGRCFAIPVNTSKPQEMKPYIDEFIKFVKNSPNNRFLITRIGCGNGNPDYRDQTIAPMFDELFPLPNVVFSIEWGVMLIDNHPSSKIATPVPPEVVDEKVLKDLCLQYRYQIGANFLNSLPEIRVRYVIDDNKFGYTTFGNFFFFSDRMYVFPYTDYNTIGTAEPEDTGIPVPTVTYKTKKPAGCLRYNVPEKFTLLSRKTGRMVDFTRDGFREMLAKYDDEKLLHVLNTHDYAEYARQLAYEEAMHRGIPEDDIDVSGTLQKQWDKVEWEARERNSAEGVVLDYFNDECWNRPTPRRVIFAGVQTPFRDANGEWIYTGDVVKLQEACSSSVYYYPVGTNMNAGVYAFMLDHNCIHLSANDKMERVGTVLYDLDKDEFPKTLTHRNYDYLCDAYGAYMYKGNLDKTLMKIQYTPNFFTKDLEYTVVKALEIEYDWRK